MMTKERNEPVSSHQTGADARDAVADAVGVESRPRVDEGTDDGRGDETKRRRDRRDSCLISGCTRE